MEHKVEPVKVAQWLCSSPKSFIDALRSVKSDVGDKELYLRLQETLVSISAAILRLKYDSDMHKIT